MVHEIDRSEATITIIAIPILTCFRVLNDIAILSRQQRLWAYEDVRQIRMNENVLMERKDISIIVQGFKAGLSNIFNSESSSYSSKDNGLIKPSNGLGINVLKVIHSGIGASTVNNSSSGARTVPSDLVKKLAFVSEMSLEHGEVMRSQLGGVEGSIVRSVFAHVIAEVSIRA